eukprot:2817834-Prymnesium_polylepis.1
MPIAVTWMRSSKGGAFLEARQRRHFLIDTYELSLAPPRALSLPVTALTRKFGKLLAPTCACPGTPSSPPRASAAGWAHRSAGGGGRSPEAKAG